MIQSGARPALLMCHWSAEQTDDRPEPLGMQADGRYDIGGLLLGRTFIDTLDQVQPLAGISQFTKPVLIVHGTNDEAVPSMHAEQYAQAAGDRGTLHWVQDADHVFSAHAWEEELFSLTLAWMNTYVPTL